MPLTVYHTTNFFSNCHTMALLSDNLWNWFNNYLHNHFNVSKFILLHIPNFVLSGVPQGSILVSDLHKWHIIIYTTLNSLSFCWWCQALWNNYTILWPFILQQDLDHQQTWNINTDVMFSINKCILQQQHTNHILRWWKLTSITIISSWSRSIIVWWSILV